jgi:hypothetical protein
MTTVHAALILYSKALHIRDSHLQKAALGKLAHHVTTKQLGNRELLEGIREVYTPDDVGEDVKALRRILLPALVKRARSIAFNAEDYQLMENLKNGNPRLRHEYTLASSIMSSMDEIEASKSRRGSGTEGSKAATREGKGKAGNKN